MLTERLAGICTWNPCSYSPTIANQGISPRITYTYPDLQEEPRPAQGVPDGGVAADILEAEDTRSVEVHAGVLAGRVSEWEVQRKERALLPPKWKCHVSAPGTCRPRPGLIR